MAVRALVAVLALVLLPACAGGDDEAEAPTTATETATGTVERAARLDFSRVETVATGLEVPWGLAFVDERTLLVTERPGRVRVVEDGRLRPEPVAELDAAAVGEAGVLGIALHPDFPAERFVYVYYTASGGNRVSRLVADDRLVLSGERVLLDRIPAAGVHDGGRIAFGPDGLLYVATGDAGDAVQAADRGSLAGKILRLRPDGAVPGNNPLPDSPVFSYGHRNPQGFAWDEQGRLYASEHGPSGEGGLCCHDELNLIERGGFYGWPHRAGTTPLFGEPPPAPPRAPIAESGEETWAPAGVVVEEGDRGERALLVANLGGEQLLRFPFEDGSRRLGEPEAVISDLGRLRAAELGPDGCLYLTTSNRDGRGSPREGDDRIVRVCPG